MPLPISKRQYDDRLHRQNTLIGTYIIHQVRLPLYRILELRKLQDVSPIPPAEYGIAAQVEGQTIQIKVSPIKTQFHVPSPQVPRFHYAEGRFAIGTETYPAETGLQIDSDLLDRLNVPPFSHIAIEDPIFFIKSFIDPILIDGRLTGLRIPTSLDDVIRYTLY